jgi:hypothetical protein
MALSGGGALTVATRAVVARAVACLLCVVLGLLTAGLVCAGALPLMQRHVSPAAAWLLACVCSIIALIAGMRLTRSPAP